MIIAYCISTVWYLFLYCTKMFKYNTQVYIRTLSKYMLLKSKQSLKMFQIVVTKNISQCRIMKSDSFAMSDNSTYVLNVDCDTGGICASLIDTCFHYTLLLSLH